MPRTTKDSGTPQKGPSTLQIRTFETWQEAFRPSLMASARMFEQAVRINQSYLAFLNHRLEQDSALMLRLAELDAPSDAPSVWADFFRTALGGYAEEAWRSAELVGEAARETTALAQKAVGSIGAAHTDASRGTA